MMNICASWKRLAEFKKDAGLKATTLNLYNSAIRFVYRNVLHTLWDDITVPRMIIDHKLPTVLTASEIDRLLAATDDLKYKAMLATMYSSGMRVYEVIHLHYDDISRTNMQIHVRDTKNRMDRFTIFSKKNLDLLTEYWFKTSTLSYTATRSSSMTRFTMRHRIPSMIFVPMQNISAQKLVIYASSIHGVRK